MRLNKYWDAILNDDIKAFENLFQETREKLFKYALYLTESSVIAEEVVLDVFYIIWSERMKINIRGSLLSYLYKAVHNQCLNVIASQKTKKASVNKLLSGDNWQRIIEWLDFNDPIIERIEALETEQLIRAIVNGLPEQCRKVFELSRFENMNNFEIAKELGISESTVKTHIFRALKVIKEKMF